MEMSANLGVQDENRQKVKRNADFTLALRFFRTMSSSSVDILTMMRLCLQQEEGN